MLLSECGDRTIARRLRRPVARKAIFAAALAVFSIGLVVAIRQLPPDLSLERPSYLILVLLAGVPLTLLMNAADTKVTAAAASARFSWPHAARVSLLASAANMLPLPGGPMVRISAMRLAGADLRRSSTVTALAAVIWLGLAFSFCGICLLNRDPLIGAVFSTCGLAALVGSVWAYYYVSRSYRLLIAALFTRALAIVVGLLRMTWALAALGLSATLAEVSVFSVSNVVGATISIVPAGLGVIEGLAALLAPLAGLSPAAAFLAASMNRIMTLVVVLLASVFLRPSFATVNSVIHDGR